MNEDAKETLLILAILILILLCGCSPAPAAPPQVAQPPQRPPLGAVTVSAVDPSSTAPVSTHIPSHAFPIPDGEGWEWVPSEGQKGSWVREVSSPTVVEGYPTPTPATVQPLAPQATPQTFLFQQAQPPPRFAPNRAFSAPRASVYCPPGGV